MERWRRQKGPLLLKVTCGQKQLSLLQRLPAGGDDPFCGSSSALTFVGKPPRFASPASGGGEKDPVKTRCRVGRGQGWRPAALAQPAVAQGDGTCWWLCARRKGDTLLQRKEMRSGKRGSDSGDRYERERQLSLPGFVTGPVFLAEPTWRWK